MKTISIIIPVYYNENSLQLLFEATLKAWKKNYWIKNINLQLIFVDDGSGDGYVS